MGGCLKDCALIASEDSQPVLDVGGVLLARLGCQLEARAEEGGAKLRHQLFCCVTFVAETIAAEIAVEA
jgi:hypothetical protein